MTRINQSRLERLESKLKVGRKQVYALIQRKGLQTHLPAELAAIALAAEKGIVSLDTRLLRSSLKFDRLPPVAPRQLLWFPQPRSDHLVKMLEKDAHFSAFKSEASLFSSSTGGTRTCVARYSRSSVRSG